MLQRPLPAEMLYYARSDTHFLLYVYDMVRNQLIEHSDSHVSDPDRNLIEWVLQRSRETSLLRYDTVAYDIDSGQGSRGWFNTLAKMTYPLNSEQFAVYKSVHKWRDDLARKEDESPGFFISQQTLMEIAKIMPSDRRALWSLFYGVPPAVKSATEELLALIAEARRRGTNGPTLSDFFHAQNAQSAASSPVAGPLKPSQDNVASTGDTDMPNVSEVRSRQSQLWGEVPMSSLWEAISKEFSESNAPITLPTGPIKSATVTALPDIDQHADSLPQQNGRIEGSQQPTKAADVADQEFTLRSGRKGDSKKPKSRNDVYAGSSDDDEAGGGATLTSPAEAAEESSKGMKKQRREEKKLKKKLLRKQKEEAQAHEAEEDAMAGDDEEQYTPFDYSMAKSVLHAMPANGGSTDGKKTFTPYASKLMADGPKPARRAQHESGAKSATFKK